MQLYSQTRRLNRNQPYPRAALILLMATCALPHCVSAQADPSQIMQRFTELQQQMAAAPDPCPFMPKMKALINEIANQSPDVFQALKPSLDLINQDDSCTDSDVAAGSSGAGAELTPSGSGEAASSGGQICPPSGFVMQQSGDVAIGVQCTPGQPIPGNTGGRTNTNAGSSSASSNSGGGNNGEKGTCHDLSIMVHIKSRWKDPKKHEGGEVVGSVTNDSITPVTCTTAFHKNGQWTEYGVGSYPSSVTRNDIWTVGADSSAVAYVCYEGKDPVDEHGHFCTENVKFTQLVPAGTEIYFYPPQ